MTRPLADTRRQWTGFRALRVSVGLCRSRTAHNIVMPPHYFAANDGGKDAIGEPSWHRMPGPTVNGTQSVSAQVSALSYCATRPGAQVTFTLSADAVVTAEALNIAGRPVKTLATDKPMQAGVRTLLWDGRSDTGVAVPAGVYLARVTAADKTGGQAQALGTVVVAR